MVKRREDSGIGKKRKNRGGLKKGIKNNATPPEADGVDNELI